MPLTEVSIRALKPKDRPYKVADSRGLHLLVTPAGGRLWRYKYRIDVREKLLAIGGHPLISLKAARDIRDDAKRSLALGNDPSAIKAASRKAEVPVAIVSFRMIADEVVAKMRREGRAAATIAKTEWLLDLAKADLGNQAISDIGAGDVLTCLRRLEERGKHESARRLRSVISSVFRYAVATTRAEVDPTSAFRGALIRPIVTPRPAIGIRGAPPSDMGLRRDA